MTIVSIISLSWWDNAQLQPRFFQSKKKGLSLGLDPAHQLKKKTNQRTGYTLETDMAMEHPPFEDVFTIENEDFPILMSSLSYFSRV